MRILLDTHILLWGIAEPSRLTSPVAAAIEEPGNELWFSAITAWEILLLVEKKRIALPSTPQVWLRKARRRLSLKEAPITIEIAIQSRLVDLPHQDPVDRFLAATAKVCNLTLVTADERLLHSRSFAVLANR